MRKSPEVSGFRAFVIGLCFIFLVGCQSANQAFYTAYGVNEVVLLTAADLTNSEEISVETAEAVLEYTDEAKATLDAAWAAKDEAEDESVSVAKRVSSSLKVFLSNLIGETDE